MPNASTTARRGIFGARIGAIGRTLRIGAVAFTSALLLAVPAGADTSEQDRQFLTGLKARGWTVTDANVLTTQGRMVCNEGLAHGVSSQEIRAQLISLGYSALDSSSLISSAVSAYCPERRDALPDTEPDAPDTPAGDHGDLFVQQLKRDQGISIAKGAAVDMAKTACSAPLQGVGLYNAQQTMQRRYPEYNNAVGIVMAQGILAYCPERLP